MKNRAERIIFSSFIKAILRPRGPFHFLCDRFANNDLTRCNSSHVDAVSHLSSLPSSIPFHWAIYSSLSILQATSGNPHRLCLSTPRPISFHQRSSGCDIISMRGGESEGFALCLRSGDWWGGRIRVREGLWYPTATAVMRTQKLLCMSAVRRAVIQKEGIYGLKCSQPQAKLLLCEDMALKTASEVVWRTLNVPLVGTLFVWVCYGLCCMSSVSQMSVYIVISSDVSEQNKSSLSDNCKKREKRECHVSKNKELIDSLNSSTTQRPT